MEYAEPVIPTKTSDLTNNSGFITKAVNDLTNYYLKSETYTKEEVQSLISAVNSVTLQKVESLPEPGESNVIYLVPKSGSGNDIYDEYIFIDGKPEHIGSTQVDLSNYVQEAPKDGKTYGRNNGTWAEITTGAGSDDYVVTIASASKRLFNAGANTIAQAAAETFLGPIDDLLAAVDAGKKVYIKNTEAKTLTELKVLHRTSNLATFFSQWAKEAFHVIDLRTVINSDKSVTNYGIRYGYQYPFQLDINAGGGIQELYGLSGDKTLTVKPDTFAPELGCVTTVMLSTLASSAANVTIAADSALEGKFSVVGNIILLN